MLIVWVILAIAFLCLEAITYPLVCLWCSIGSVAAAIAAAMDAAIEVQIGMFGLVSGVLFFLYFCVIRPLFNRGAKKKQINLDYYTEKDAVVVEEIDNLKGTGMVKSAGSLWTARSEDGSVIPQGEIVKFVRIEGVTAIVTK